VYGSVFRGLFRIHSEVRNGFVLVKTVAMGDSASSLVFLFDRIKSPAKFFLRFLAPYPGVLGGGIESESVYFHNGRHFLFDLLYLGAFGYVVFGTIVGSVVGEQIAPIAVSTAPPPEQRPRRSMVMMMMMILWI